MKISEFIDSDDGFRGYVRYDNDRSLPHLMDGLKITQRKVLYAFVENIGYQKLVCDKAGMRAADLTHYQHGATSMIGVLVGMNQDFPGANNLPLFEKDGQFGTRLSHEPSSERYISTRLSDAYKKLFDPADNLILNEQFYHGDKIEPEFYLPKLPLLLMNGSSGTGNGYASEILQYHPEEVKQAVEEVLKTGKVQNKLIPYLNGYYGDVLKNTETGQVTFEGQFERKGANTLIITELTPSMQLDAYKEHLNKLMTTRLEADGPCIVKDYDNESTEEGWRFVVDVPRTISALPDEDLKKHFKLYERTTENLTVWLPNGRLKKYLSVEELIEDWVALRLEFYEKRRLDQINRNNSELDWLKTKLDFIQWWNENSSDLVRLKKSELKDKIDINVTRNEGYIDRLMSIRVSNLGLEEVDALKNEIDKYEGLVAALEKTTNKRMMTAEVKGIKL